MDYKLMAGAKSGFAKGRGPAKIAGTPEGSHPSAPMVSRDGKSVPVRHEGVIRGMPVGIKGKTRKLTSPALRKAIHRRLGR